MTLSLRTKAMLCPLLVVVSGVLTALASPYGNSQWSWVVALALLFVAIDWGLQWCDRLEQPQSFTPSKEPQQHTPKHYTWRKWGVVCGCAFGAGLITAGLGADWIIHTAQLFGGMPAPLAYMVAWLGYGSVLGLEWVLFLGVPFYISHHVPKLGLLLVPLWAACGQSLLPRIVDWHYGYLLSSMTPVIQAADIMGGGGLTMLYVGLQLAIYHALKLLFTAYLPYLPARLYIHGLSRRWVLCVAVVISSLFMMAGEYGIWRSQQLAQQQGKPLYIAGLQPNFSFARLAHGPLQEGVVREGSFSYLLQDSMQALYNPSANAPNNTPVNTPDNSLPNAARHASNNEPKQGSIPRLLVWPESVFYYRYLDSAAVQTHIARFTQQYQTHLMLASVEYSEAANRQPFGASLHIAPDGALQGIYKKNTLIPFGEYIPLAQWLPAFGSLVQQLIPMVGNFEAGTKPTVFAITPQIKVAPMICYDLSNAGLLFQQVDQGANLAVAHINLAWFGRSKASEFLAWLARFQAITTRVPLLFLSQNGKSMLFNNRGEVLQRLPLFRQGAIQHTLSITHTPSFYVQHRFAIHLVWAIALGVALYIALRNTLVTLIAPIGLHIGLFKRAD